MAGGEDLAPPHRSSAPARGAGLHGTRELTLSDVDRRRSELWTVSILVVAAVTVAIAVLSAGRDILPEALRFEELSSWIVVVLLGGLALAFLLYVLEKARSLRRVTRMLIEERVHSETLESLLEEMTRLSEMTKAVNATLELEAVLTVILSSALDLLDATVGSVLLFDDKSGQLRVASQMAVEDPPPDDEIVRQGMALADRVVAERRPLLSDDSDGAGSSMSAPLVHRDELFGALTIGDSRPDMPFTDRELDALGLFAEHAAVAIANARAFARERESVVKLEELDRLKNDFVATVSHELRTPLTAIIGATKTLSQKGRDMDASQHQMFIEMITRQAERLQSLVEDVLTASSIESGPPRLRRERIDLRQVVEDVVTDLKQTTLGAGRRVDIRTHPQRPEVWGDEVAITQILSNLVENALKYSDGAAPVEVLVRETDQGVNLEVSDEGRGIDPEQLKTIFDRFRQVDSSGTRSVGGVGLGLFIVKNLVEAHNGTIAVDSEVGTGTIFRINLPKRSDRKTS